jgi:hypothetical protein
MDEKYFVAKIQYDLPDENSGKIKKIREEKLVKGFSVTDVEAKVTKSTKVSHMIGELHQCLKVKSMKLLNSQFNYLFN